MRSFLPQLEALAARRSPYFQIEMRSLVAQHPPEGGPARMLNVLGFSKDGMRLEGEPLYDVFEITWLLRQGAKIHIPVEVVNESKNYFEVKFLKPHAKVDREFDYWKKQKAFGQVKNADRLALSGDIFLG